MDQGFRRDRGGRGVPVNDRQNGHMHNTTGCSTTMAEIWRWKIWLNNMLKPSFKTLRSIYFPERTNNTNDRTNHVTLQSREINCSQLWQNRLKKRIPSYSYCNIISDASEYIFFFFLYFVTWDLEILQRCSGIKEQRRLFTALALQIWHARWLWVGGCGGLRGGDGSFKVHSREEPRC